MELERQWDNYLKEIVDTSTQLSHRYDQRIVELMARAQGLQSTCEIITRRCQQKAKAAKDELDICRAQYKMGKTRIKAIVANHWQKLNNKVEEALARGWQEWSAQAAELQVLRVDAENRRKEARGF